VTGMIGQKTLSGPFGNLKRALNGEIISCGILLSFFAGSGSSIDRERHDAGANADTSLWSFPLEDLESHFTVGLV